MVMEKSICQPCPDNCAICHAIKKGVQKCDVCSANYFMNLGVNC
jgi:hypothetical protein